MANIVIYSTHSCPYCVKAKALFDSKGLSYTEYYIDEDESLRQEMMEKSQRRTVPQIFIDEQHIGGCDDLYALDREGKLDPLLSTT